MVQTEAGRFDSAAPLLTEALEQLRRRGTPGTAEYASALTDIGFGWQVQGRSERAESLLVEALGEYERLPEPTLDMGRTLTNLGYLHISRGEPDSAEVFFRRSVEIRQQFGGADQLPLSNSLEALAGVLLRRGQLAAADSAADAALHIRRRVLPEGHYLIAGSIEQRGSILQARGDLVGAEALLRQALEMRVTSLGADHFLVAYSRNSLALLLKQEGQNAEAERLFRLALGGYQRRFGADHVNPAIVELNLARFLLEEGARARALPHFAHAVPIGRAAFPRDRGIVNDLAALGTLNCASKPTDGLRELREAVTALQPADTAVAPDDYLRTLNSLGDCLARAGQPDEARRVLSKSLNQSSGRPDDDPVRSFALRLLERLGRSRP
jgi:tetratricopeptide (TPR) repeat protein